MRSLKTFVLSNDGGYMAVARMNAGRAVQGESVAKDMVEVTGDAVDLTFAGAADGAEMGWAC